MAPKQPTYTDEEIIASIKNELSDRLARHNPSQQPNPIPTQPEFDFDSFSSTEPGDDDFIFSSTEMSDIDIDFEDDDTVYQMTFIDPNVLIEGARKQFADDFVAMAETINHLDAALLTLNNADDYADNADIAAIKNQIKALLEDYYLVEIKTDQLLQMIGEIANEQNRRKMLGFGNSHRINDDLEDENILDALMHRFGNDIGAMEQTMANLEESMDQLKRDSDPRLLRLVEKISDLLDVYVDVIEGTKKLVQMIKYAN